MKTKRLIVVSLDAMGTKDLERMAESPAFSRVLAKGVVCKEVSSIYPSLTYPAHTTIVTGRLPGDHGVINNTLLQPWMASPDWYWQRKYIRTTTIYDEAAKKGLKTAAILWPVTAKAKNIAYNAPEIFANRPWTNQIAVSLANGSKAYQFELNQKFGHLRKGISQPELDDFTTASMLHTLEKYQPDLTFVHLTDLDFKKHEHGADSAKAHDALYRHEERIARLLETLDKLQMDLEKDTTLILLGDHSQLDFDKIMLLNKIFMEKGWLEADRGVIKSWKAVCKNCDGSAYIYLNTKGMKHDERQRLRRDVHHLVEELRADGDYGIIRVYPGEQAGRMGADPDCFLMLEARSGWCFQDAVDEAYLTEHHKATHGYHPERKHYHTIFIGVGPDFKQGFELPSMSLTDEGPIMAKLLGLDLGETAGSAPEAMFRQS